MIVKQKIELYLNTIINEGLHSKKVNLQFQIKTLFKGIDFMNKRVLDIGGGTGLNSFYAACSGAKEVVCLEPEAKGSTNKVTEIFHKINKLLKLDNVILKQVTFQTFESQCKKFDIILLYNSINHLDEKACINLLKDESSKNIYKEIFLKINSLAKKGSKLIICDCSRYNFFALFKIRNPFSPTIEWQKHQAPEVWVNLLSSIGFVNPRIRWSSFNRFRWLGRVLFGNKFIAYLLTSHFCITMNKL